MKAGGHIVTLTDYEYVETIIAVVQRAYGIKDLTVRSRTKRVSEARRVAMYLAREITEFSYPELGDAFRRDHTTVLSAYKNLRDRIERDERLAAVVGRLVVTIRQEVIRQSER